MTDGIGRQHFQTAEKLLAAVAEERDADWAQVTATRALAHATLAAAARDYALHVAPRVEQQFTAAGKPVVEDAPAEVIDLFRARDIRKLRDILESEDE